ncbi:phage holin family protein [Escherichia sp. E4930]|uniref:phage holin family protein n=1 Tax=Escherichia sp. E4930 TaxID=2044468 RepID=UPI0014366D35|nr:phage holin family protein [Escherichia sp. E4930]
MGVSNFILTLNAFTCALIVLVLLAYQRSGANYCWKSSFCAWLLMVACGSVTILILTGVYRHPSIPETVINIALLVTVWGAGGNISRLVNSRKKLTGKYHDKRRDF